MLINRAHWLVVHGFFMALPHAHTTPEASSASTPVRTPTQTLSSPDIVTASTISSSPSSSIISSRNNTATATANASLYLLCRHTLHGRSLIVPFGLLRRSNANLTTAHPRFTLKKPPNLKGMMVIVQMTTPPISSLPSSP
jgi:hypothetical protein